MIPCEVHARASTPSESSAQAPGTHPHGALCRHRDPHPGNGPSGWRRNQGPEKPWPVLSSGKNQQHQALPPGRGTRSRGHQGRWAWVMVQKTAQGVENCFGFQPRESQSPVLFLVLPARLPLTQNQQSLQRTADESPASHSAPTSLPSASETTTRTVPGCCQDRISQSPDQGNYSAS